MIAPGLENYREQRSEFTSPSLRDIMGPMEDCRLFESVFRCELVFL